MVAITTNLINIIPLQLNANNILAPRRTVKKLIRKVTTRLEATGREGTNSSIRDLMSMTVIASLTRTKNSKAPKPITNKSSSHTVATNFRRVANRQTQVLTKKLISDRLRNKTMSEILLKIIGEVVKIDTPLTSTIHHIHILNNQDIRTTQDALRMKPTRRPSTTPESSPEKISTRYQKNTTMKVKILIVDLTTLTRTTDKMTLMRCKMIMTQRQR